MYYLQTDKTVKTASIFITYVLLTQDSQDRETVKTINTVKTKSVFITYALLTQDRKTVKTVKTVKTARPSIPRVYFLRTYFFCHTDETVIHYPTALHL